MDNMEIQ